MLGDPELRGFILLGVVGWVGLVAWFVVFLGILWLVIEGFSVVCLFIPGWEAWLIVLNFLVFVLIIVLIVVLIDIPVHPIHPF